MTTVSCVLVGSTGIFHRISFIVSSCFTCILLKQLDMFHVLHILYGYFLALLVVFKTTKISACSLKVETKS